MECALDEKFSSVYFPVYEEQTRLNFKVYGTPKSNQRFCNESGMRFIGNLDIKLPDVELKLDRPVEFSLIFGEFLITATAKNQKTGKTYTADFEYVKSDSCCSVPTN